jgi:hypothetical protein
MGLERDSLAWAESLAQVSPWVYTWVFRVVLLSFSLLPFLFCFPCLFVSFRLSLFLPSLFYPPQRPVFVSPLPRAFETRPLYAPEQRDASTQINPGRYHNNHKLDLAHTLYHIATFILHGHHPKMKAMLKSRSHFRLGLSPASYWRCPPFPLSWVAESSAHCAVETEPDQNPAALLFASRHFGTLDNLDLLVTSPRV